MLVEDMTQLCGEIRAWRGAREEMVTGLRDEAAGLSRSVSATLDGFRRSRIKLAREAKDQRRAFVVALRDGVADFRQEFASVMADVHRAWTGHPASKSSRTGSEHSGERSRGVGRRTSHSKGKP